MALPDYTSDDAATWAANVDSAISDHDTQVDFQPLKDCLLYLDLENGVNFIKGVGSATFSRSSTATYVDRYGVLQTAAVDEPRFETEGYLSERQETNELLNSEDLSSWPSNFQSTITTNAAAAPDGAMTADHFARDANSGVHTINSTLISTAAGATVAFSAFVKAEEFTSGSVSVYADASGSTFYGTWDFDLSAETFSLTTGPSNGATIPANNSPKIISLADGWYRIMWAVTLDAGDSNVRMRFTIDDTGSSGDGYYLWGGDMKEGSPVVSSYIPTTSSSVTRNADSMEIPAADNIPLQADAWSVLADVSLNGDNGNFPQYVFDIDETSRFLRNSGASGNRPQTQCGDVTVISSTASTHFTKERWGAVYTSSNLKVYLNGELEGQSAAGDDTDSLGTTLYIGQNKSNAQHLLGHISSLRIYDRALSDVEMVAA